ncbi:hypothetical protein [Sporosarcina obsidiansis]|uniref:hypothetical protein n=1 Tax=Sporosarcina obsidiansis TaxID=2660748 RepID=UPI00129A1EDF|nr:hypothetical protein [Sporosarcina obsidiansis]
MDEKLTSREKWDITIQTGLQLVPYVGGALATSYFSVKQEKRFKRLETFYKELSEQISGTESHLPSADVHDKESLIALIERINDEIERESSTKKREYFKNFFINILRKPTLDSNYDERRIFLDALANLTVLEFEVLLVYSEYKQTDTEDVTEKARIAQASGRLEMYGFLEGSYMSFLGGTTVKTLTITQLGINFINYCKE